MSFFTSFVFHYYPHNPGCKEKPYSNFNYLKLTPKHSFTSSFYLFRTDWKNIMSFLVRDALTYDDQQFHVNIIRKMCCAYVDKPKLLVFQVPCSKRFFFGCSCFPFPQPTFPNCSSTRNSDGSGRGRTILWTRNHYIIHLMSDPEENS